MYNGYHDWKMLVQVNDLDVDKWLDKRIHSKISNQSKTLLKASIKKAKHMQMEQQIAKTKKEDHSTYCSCTQALRTNIAMRQNALQTVQIKRAHYSHHYIIQVYIENKRIMFDEYDDSHNIFTNCKDNIMMSL